MEDIKDLRGLRVFAPTDRRDFDIWAFDESFCHRFLAANPRPSWKTAIRRYWGERCTRRELADELHLTLDAIKSLLRTIRKAAKDFQTGKTKPRTEISSASGRCHGEINRRDIYAICDGDPDAIAHAEEYRRLSVLDLLRLFSPDISPDLIETQNHSDAIGHTKCRDIAEKLVAKANQLKAQAAKADSFEGRPVIQRFVDYRTAYRPDRRGRPRKEVRKPEPPLNGLRIMPVSFLGDQISQG